RKAAGKMPRDLSLVAQGIGDGGEGAGGVIGELGQSGYIGAGILDGREQEIRPGVGPNACLAAGRVRRRGGGGVGEGSSQQVAYGVGCERSCEARFDDLCGQMKGWMVCDGGAARLRRSGGFGYGG